MTLRQNSCVELTNIDGRALGVDVVVNVGGAQGEEGRAAAAEQKLGQQEEQHGAGGRRRRHDAVVRPGAQVVAGRKRR